MLKDNRIQAGQFYSILFVSRVLSTMTYIPHFTKGSISTDQLIEVILSGVGVVISVIPMYFLLKNSRDRNILDHSYTVSPLFAKIISIVYAAVFIFAAISVITRFDVFVSMEIFLGYDYSTFIIIIILASCYAAWLGIEAIARSAVITTVILIIALITVSATLSERIEMLNFNPVLYDGFAKKILQPSLISISRTVEILAIEILLPKVTGNVKRGFAGFVLGTVAAAELLFFLATAVLGEFGNTKFFPLYTISILAEFSVFQRFNALVTGVWIFCVFIKTGFLIYLAAECAERVIKPKRRPKLIIVSACGGIVTAVTLLISGNIRRFEAISTPIISMSIFSLLIVVLPIILLIVRAVKKGRKMHEESN